MRGAASPWPEHPMSILQQARFFTTVAELDQLPRLGLPELAFAGRSNAGKSTAINTLCQQKRLAFASKTPGRTQHLNFFAVGTHSEDRELPAAFLVDLPGYGYAEAGQAMQSQWGDQLGAYIRQRDPLVGLFVIMDARHAMGPLDCALIDWFAPTAKPLHVLLTKSDKLNRSDAQRVLRETQDALAPYGAHFSAALFSSLKRSGVEEAEAIVLDWLGLPEATPRKPAQSIAQKKAPTQGE